MTKNPAFTERAKLQNRVEQLLSKFQDFHARLSDRHPDTDRLLWIEDKNVPLFSEGEMDDIQEGIEAIMDFGHDDSIDLPEVKEVLDLLDENKIDRLSEEFAHDTSLYQIMTFDHQTRVARIVEGESNEWNFGDDIDRCVEYASGLADEEFEKLVGESDVDSIVNEFGKIVTTLESLSQALRTE